LDTSQSEHLLDGRGSDEASSSRSRDQSHSHGARLASHLAGDGVGLAHSGTPVTSSNGDQAHLSVELGTFDGVGDFASDLHAKANVAGLVSNNDESLESSSLTSCGLLLDGHDLHDHILEARAEGVHDLVLLDGEREEEDLLHGSDLAGLD
jgi:hypothetical protein